MINIYQESASQNVSKLLNKKVAQCIFLVQTIVIMVKRPIIKCDVLLYDSSKFIYTVWINSRVR